MRGTKISFQDLKNLTWSINDILKYQGKWEIHIEKLESSEFWRKYRLWIYKYRNHKDDKAGVESHRQCFKTMRNAEQFLRGFYRANNIF